MKTSLKPSAKKIFRRFIINVSPEKKKFSHMIGKFNPNVRGSVTQLVDAMWRSEIRDAGNDEEKRLNVIQARKAQEIVWKASKATAIKNRKDALDLQS